MERLMTLGREAYLERLRLLRPIDDDFMRCLFRENIPLVQFVLRILIRKPDLIITRCETQADMKRVTGARSLCLDAYGTDAEGKKYDLEIQRADHGASPHRARYHSSVMDVENLKAGQDFSELPDTYTIFITEKDFFGKGEPIYLIQNMNLTTGEPFHDGAHILYVNGEYRGEDALGKLMHDFFCSNAKEMHYPIMAEKTRYLKENPKGVGEMCKLLEDMMIEVKADALAQGMAQGMKQGMKQGMAQGMKQGMAQGKFDTLVKLFRSGVLTLPQAAENAGLSEEEFRGKMMGSDA